MYEGVNCTAVHIIWGHNPLLWSELGAEVVCAAHLVDQAEGVGHELDNSVPDVVLAQVHLIQELLGHREQGALGPGLEPVDDGGGDGGEEALGADAEVLTHGGGGVHLMGLGGLGTSKVGGSPKLSSCKPWLQVLFLQRIRAQDQRVRRVPCGA